MADVADYCRQVEAHLTRINGGHLVRVVGSGFTLVKQWADEGVPLSVVFRGIEHKAERHAAGASRRPLRIEFCEADVRALYDDWRRAIGVAAVVTIDHEEPKRRSSSKAVERAIERLGRLAGRLELSDEFRDAASRALDVLTELRGTRGAVRAQWLEQLPAVERDLLTHARSTVSADVLQVLTKDAELDLAPYRDRLDAEAWDRAVSVTVDRGVREHLGLPVLDF